MKGVYGLLLKLPRDDEFEIGKLGPVEFKSGYYVYIGSALGSLKARINRHRKLKKNLRWHIDYLVAKAIVVEIIYAETTEKKECNIARGLSRYFNSIANFGSSDCGCQSHLFYFSSLDDLRRIVRGVLNENGLSPKVFVG
ncbi:MAG: GIY-YIG nuclease family protein [Actinomycetota bacterium]|nr:GIY-YIG nuclease family protein [Actinomycetota bacterium]